MRISRALVIGGVILGAIGLARRASVAQAPHPEWSRDAVIYEMNVRQFTPEGTFRAILPRVAELKRLGVKIVWFMPIHSIGVEKRKGTLGSYYAVGDYYGVNPEHGTLEDFRELVQAFHRAGMYVLIDLVANHTAWDNPLAREHPEWYKRDARGNFVPPVPDWQDVIALDYRNRGLRQYMIEMMEYWVRDVGIDGFRCDVADFVPTSFWEEARPRLERIKPVFMLAEAESTALVKRAFDCDYASEYFLLFTRIAKNKGTVDEIDRLLARDARTYTRGAWRMMFTTNHDQNTWLEADVKLYGPAASRAFATLAFALPGRPLIYSGQEVGNPRRLAFFERDPIDWHTPEAASYREFYTRLCALYHQYPVLQRGTMKRLRTRNPVYAFERTTPREVPLMVVTNLSSAPAQWDVPRGNWLDLLSDRSFTGGRVALAPWSAHILHPR